MKMHEEKPAYNEMFLMYRDGMTCQQIADEFHVARQWVNYILTRYYGTKGMRGRGFDIQTIVYKGIYEHFKNNQYESLTSFTEKVQRSGIASTTKVREFITGKTDSQFKLSQIQRMLEITGTTFEECFERRDVQ